MNPYKYKEDVPLNINSNSTNRGKKNNNTMDKDSCENDGTEIQDQHFDIYALGSVKYAKIHKDCSQPWRPKDDAKTKNKNFQNVICPCCSADKDSDTHFSTCDNPDDYYNFGQGVVLYYAFLKYVVAVMFICGLCICGLNIHYILGYYDELTEVCNNYYEEEIINGSDSLDMEEACKCYYTDISNTSYKYYSHINEPFFRFSLVNIDDYLRIYKRINSTNKDDFDDTVINFSRTNFIGSLFLFAFNLYFIFYLFNKSNEADVNAFTVSDFTIFLYNLYDVHKFFLESQKQINYLKSQNQSTPQKESELLGAPYNPNESELERFKKFLTTKIVVGSHGEKFNINRIDICYKIKDLMDLQKKCEKKKEKIAKVETFPEFAKKNDKLEGDARKYYSGFLECDSDNEKPLSEIKKKKDEIQQKIEDLIAKSKSNTSEYFGGAAFITFNDIKEQELYMKNIPTDSVQYFFHFMKQLYYTFFSCCVNKTKISYIIRNVKFEEAPEPEDMKFENLDVSPVERTIRTILVYIISVIICGVSFGIIVGLNQYQKHLDEENSGSMSLLYIMSLILSIITSVIDVVLEIVLDILTQIEKQSSWTDYYLSYSVKLTIFTFLNSAVLPLVSELVFTQSDGYYILISNMLMKFALNAVITPVMWTLNVGYYMKLIQICLIEKKILKGSKSQKDLNALYELPSMNVSAKYSYIFKTLLMSFLYIPIFPFGPPVSFLGFLLGYWLEKYNFAHRYKKPEMLNRQLAEFYMNYFVVCLFTFAIGDYIFLHDVYDTNLYCLLSSIAFGILIIVPYHKILSIKYIDIKDSDFFKSTYQQSYDNLDFNFDYERANPMTKNEGEERFDNARRKKGVISNEEYEQNRINRQKRDNFGSFFAARNIRTNDRAFMNQSFIPPQTNLGSDPNVYNRNMMNNNQPYNNNMNFNNQNIYQGQMNNQYPPQGNNIPFNPVNNMNPSSGYSSSDRLNNNQFNPNQGYPPQMPQNIPPNMGYSSQ